MIGYFVRVRVDLALLVVAASWGSTYLAAKELVAPNTVVALLSVRMLLAAAIMSAIVAVRQKQVNYAELRVGVLLGVMLSVVFALETFGIAHTSATNAGLIISLTIVFTPMLDSVASARRLSRQFLLAAGTAVVGVAFLATNGDLRPPSLGDVLVLGAATMRAVHVICLDKYTIGKTVDSLNLTTVQVGTCGILFTGISMVSGVPIPTYLAQLDAMQIFLLVYLVVVCTVFAFFTQTWAVRRTSPSRVSLLLGTEPVWAVVAGIVIAHDTFEIIGYLGITLILAGTAVGRSIEQRGRVPSAFAQ
ncbi:DMT family transporter [Parafrigoribacterium mesophilum]|uniref:DMT family transporter n=1 Tax=Parafrigoribacterium mesophilum TaxID=433646 RepID=UPI0031FD195B